MLASASVVVTGASSGLGREFARELATKVRALALVARRKERLETLREELAVRAPGLRVSTHACDLVDRSATEALLDDVMAEHGAIDVLINNAGIGSFGRFSGAHWADVERMLRLNVETHTYLVFRVLPPMLERGWGRILNVASGQGFQPLPGFASYAGSKHYVVGFTECLQMELRGTGVAVTLLCPGQTRTEFFDGAGEGSSELLPAFMEMEAAPVVRAAVRALERGSPMVVSGLRNRLALLVGALSPRALRHRVLMLRFSALERRRLVAAQLRTLPHENRR